MKSNDIICWFSGGVTSAVAVWLAIQIFGISRCRIVFIDTKNEDPDSYRFLKDCEFWYGKRIEFINRKDVEKIQDVWLKYNGLNFANGAICSSELKREMRIRFQKENPIFEYQIFGFDIDEPRRAKNMTLNYPEAKSIYPLLLFGYDKKKCISILQENGIKIPRAYEWGFHNNNCLQTGCVQGGIGYWQKIQTMFPDKFDKMAETEHKLTNRKGKPVTMLRIECNKIKMPLFLKPHPKYLELPKFSEQKGRPPKPLTECNGFCGINDGTNEVKNETYSELNVQNNRK